MAPTPMPQPIGYQAAPAPTPKPAPAPAPVGGVAGALGGAKAKAPEKLLTGDLRSQLLAALGGAGFQQYDDDNPLGPKGYWAMIGRDTGARDRYEGVWAGPQYEFFNEDGGFGIGDWDKSTSDAAEWKGFLDLWGSRLPPALLQALRGWAG